MIFIGGLLAFVGVLIVLPETTDEDKRALDQIRLMLKGKDAKEFLKKLSYYQIEQSKSHAMMRINETAIYCGSKYDNQRAHKHQG